VAQMVLDREAGAVVSWLGGGGWRVQSGDGDSRRVYGGAAAVGGHGVVWRV
jgi:hypothetical protein